MQGKKLKKGDSKTDESQVGQADDRGGFGIQYFFDQRGAIKVQILKIGIIDTGFRPLGVKSHATYFTNIIATNADENRQYNGHQTGQ